MLALRRTLTGFLLVSVMLSALLPLPVLGQPAVEVLMPTDVAMDTTAEFSAPRMQEEPQRYLARITDDADLEALAAFLQELYAQEQIGAFQWLEEAQAFLITGEKGLALVIARPEVQEIVEATPETLALPPLALDVQTPESPAQPAHAALELPPDAATETGEVFLLRLRAPETLDTLDAAYERITFELDYLQQSGQIGAYRWLPEANAAQVVVLQPQALDFLRRLAEVEGVSFWEETELEQAQTEHKTTLRELHSALNESMRQPAQMLAYTPTRPTIAARLYSDYISLNSDTDATTVITLTTSTGALKNDPTRTYVYLYCDWGWCWGAAYLRDANYNSVMMMPGDILYVAQSGQTPFTMTLSHLMAYADAAANIVTGEAPPGITSTDPITPPVLQVSVNGTQYVTTTASGGYIADNVGDFNPGDGGMLRYYDARGNQTYLEFRAPVVGVRGLGGYSSNYLVAGYAPTGNASVSIDLKRDGAIVVSTNLIADSDGYFGAYLSESILGGDVVEVQSNDWSVTVDVPTFAVTSDPDTDTVTGNTDATVVTTTYGAFETLAVWPTSYNDWDYGKYVQLDGNGDFSAVNPFYYAADPNWGSATLDWGLGAAGHLRYMDENGNRTYYRFRAPLPPPVLYARAYGSYAYYYSNTYLGGYISGFCSNEDGYGTATLRAAGGTLKAEITNVSACPDIYVNFNVPIEGGDVISATFGGKTTTMTVPALTATVNSDTDTIAGATDATVVTTTYGLTQTLTVWPNTPYDSEWSTSYARKRLLPDVNGAFTAANPFERYECFDMFDCGWVDVSVDIRPGDTGHLRYLHADGNRTYVGFTAPGLYVRGTQWGYTADNYVYVRAAAGLPVAVTLKRGGATLATATGLLSSDNAYGVYLTDEYGAPVLIQAGDVVEAALPGQTLTVEVPALTATPNTGTGMVSGHAPANITNTMEGYTHTLRVHRSRDWVAYQVTTDASGAYSADFTPNGGLHPGDTGWLRYINTSGYYIYDNYWVPVVYVRGYEYGYQAENYVTGHVAEAGVVVTATLKRDSDIVAVNYGRSHISTGQFSIYLRDQYGYNANTLGGDTLEIQSGGVTTVVPVPQFAVNSNPDTDTVSGTTDAVVTSQTPYMTQTLAIWPTGRYYWDYGKHVVPESGAFTASNPFYYNADSNYSSTWIDVWYGATGHARYINADGNRVYMRVQAPIKPVVHVRGYYSNNSYNAENSIGGYVNGFCGYGTATLKDGAGTVKAQTHSAWACSSLYAYFYDAAGNAAPILPGDRVEVTFGGATTVVDVPTFAVTSDPINNRLTGTTNAVVGAGAVTQTLALWPDSWYDSDYGKRVAVAAGAFTADNPFYAYAEPTNTSMTLDWLVGASGHLRYVDADGNRVYGRFKVHYTQPVLYLRGDYWQQRYVADNYVSGYVPGFCGALEITVRNSSGVRVYLRNLRACHDFEVYLYGANGVPINLQPGDTVEAAFLETSIVPVVVTVPEFTADSDHVNRTVTGSTNATVVTTTYGLPQTLAVWPTSLEDRSYGKYVQPAGGVFSATNPFYWGANPARGSAMLGWSAGTIGHLRYIDAQWNHIYTRVYRDDVWLYLRGDHYFYSDKGYYAENLVSGYAPGFCGYGSLTLKDSGGTVKAQNTNVSACNSFSVYLYDNVGQAAYIQAGDQVEAVFGGVTKTLAVPTFTAHSDAEQDRVTGTTDAVVGDGATLTVYPTSVYEYDSAPYKNVQLAAGVFTATNPFFYYGSSSTWVDIQPGQQGHLRYTYASGDRVHYRFMAQYPTPRVWVWKDSNSVYAYSFQPHIAVTVTLRRGGNVIATAQARTDGIGYFYSYFYDAENKPVNIREGDTVRVECGPSTIDVPLVPLTAQADAAQDAVWGVGPANAMVTVSGANYPFATGADGAYYADLRGLNDLRPGSWYQVAYRNAEWHTVYIGQYIAQTNAQLHSNYIWGYGMSANSPVTATLKAGATVKGTANFSTSSWYNFSAYLLDTTGNPALIAPGDTLEVDFGGSNVVTLPIVALTTHIDTTTGAVTGTGPANALLGLEVNAYSGNRSVTTDGAGQWATQVLDFYSWSDAHVRARYANPQGHAVWLYTVVRPVVYVRGTGSGFSYSSDQTVSGYADGRALVNLSLKRGGNVVAERRVVASSSGWYNTVLTESIQAGDQLVVQWTPRASHTIVVPTLEADGNAATGVIAGTGPANAIVGVRAHNYARAATTASDGAFSVAMPLVTGNELIYLRYQTPTGDWIHARSTSAPPPALNAAFIQSATSIIVGNTVYFTDTSTTDGAEIVSWNWSFGDGGVSAVQHPSHQYDSAGTFTVQLTVADALGYTANATSTVMVTEGCVPLTDITFSYLPLNPRVNMPVMFTASYTPVAATSPVTYTWAFGDGGTSTVQNPVHIYTSVGTRLVQVTAYNACTPDGVTYSQSLVIELYKVYLPLTLRD